MASSVLEVSDRFILISGNTTPFQIAIGQGNGRFQVPAFGSLAIPIECRGFVSFYANPLIENASEIPHGRSMVQFRRAAVPERDLADVLINAPYIFVTLGQSVFRVRIHLVGSDLESTNSCFIVLRTSRCVSAHRTNYRHGGIEYEQEDDHFDSADSSDCPAAIATNNVEMISVMTNRAFIVIRI